MTHACMCVCECELGWWSRRVGPPELRSSVRGRSESHPHAAVLHNHSFRKGVGGWGGIGLFTLRVSWMRRDVPPGATSRLFMPSSDTVTSDLWLRNQQLSAIGTETSGSLVVSLVIGLRWSVYWNPEQRALSTEALRRPHPQGRPDRPGSLQTRCPVVPCTSCCFG